LLLAYKAMAEPIEQLEALEEDDEFQEFEHEWGPSEMDAEDKRVWQDDWDAEDPDDAFTRALRMELTGGE